jgi:translocation and assembly module TamB
MKKKVIIITSAILLLGVFLYASRGPNISNTLKKLILPELELITGKKFIAQKIYINIIPLFIEMKGVKTLDDNGDTILSVERVKGYIGLSGLLSNKIAIKRLVVKHPEISAKSSQLYEILDSVKLYLAKENRAPFKVVVKSVEVSDARMTFREGDELISLNGLNAEAIISDNPRFRVSSRSFSFAGKGIADLRGAFEILFTIKDNTVEIKTLKIASSGSELESKASLDTKSLKGLFDVNLRLLLSSVKGVFGLKSNGEGEIIAEGTLKLDKLKPEARSTFINIKVHGDLYLETLMELLQVKENLKGYLKVKGEINGYLKDLKGTAVADLRKGNLFGVEVDALSCNVSYRDRLLKFNNGIAQLYNGAALAEATLRLPYVDFYSFSVKVKEVNSKGLFKLIKWDPLIPAGKVTGEISSHGNSFAPSGRFIYKSVPKNGDILDKVKDASGSFEMSGDVISLRSLSLDTGVAHVDAAGSVDFANKTLAFTGTGLTSDVKEFSAPYFTALSGPVKFTVSVRGALNDPELEAQIDSTNALFNTGGLGAPDVFREKAYILDALNTSLLYRKNLLSVRALKARSAKEEIGMAGNIYFRQAKKLFDVKYPDFDLAVYGRNIEAKGIAEAFKDSPHFSGTTDTNFRLQGQKDDLRATGDFRARDISLDNTPVGNFAEGNVAYWKKKFNFPRLVIRKGISTMNAEGSISLDRNFSFTLDGEKIGCIDLVPLKHRGKLASKLQDTTFLESLYFTAVNMKGDGTFDHPHISAAGEVSGGQYKGRLIGRGNFSMTLDGNDVTAAATLLDGKLSAKGTAHLSGEMPWSADMDLQPARYDLILANFMRELPEDLLLTLKGTIHMQGDRKHLNAVASIDKAHLYLYGTGFSNNSSITAKLQDGKLSLENLSMKSDTTEFRVGGKVDVGKGYDLLIEGSSSLAPVKAFFRNIEVIKGNATFVLGISGDWEKPKINGSMDVTGGTLGLKGIHSRLSSVSAYMYVDDDRIVIQEATGKLSGGDISVSGTAYIQKFALKRFFLDSHVKGLTAALEKDLWVNLDGDLQYRGTSQTQTLSGDITARRARYSGRIEWKSWLLKSMQKERIKTEVSKLDMTNLNIRLSGTNLIIDNNVARSSMKMDLLLRGTVGQPVLLGKVEAKEGIVFFRNNEFNILRVTVDFSNPNQIHPYFDIMAETKVRSYNIRLSLNGYSDQFSFTLSSDPPLNETDIFSLLTVGYIGKNLKGLEGGIGAGEATSFLTGKLQDVVEERLKTVTGFDRVQIDPYISKSTGTVTPRVTIAKRLMSDKLYVTYSTSVATGEEQVWKLEYILGKNISLVGVRDEKGGLGGDIKFRFEFK